MASRTSKMAATLLKCFCGCSELTLEEVQTIYRLSAQETLINGKARFLFRKYLKTKQSGDDKLETECYLDVYEKCEELLSWADDRIITLDELDELDELGMPYEQIVELKKVIKTGDRSKINHCLIRIQGRIRDLISDESDYRIGFKQAILDKMKQVPSAE